ncbi:MAG: hypothetical protein ACO1NW_19620 [Chitinophagaceae bacterium]
MLRIEQNGDITRYRVEPDANYELLQDFIPRWMEFDVDGTAQFDERINTVEGAEIAQAVWKGIKAQREGNQDEMKSDQS